MRTADAGFGERVSRLPQPSRKATGPLIKSQQEAAVGFAAALRESISMMIVRLRFEASISKAAQKSEVSRNASGLKNKFMSYEALGSIV